MSYYFQSSSSVEEKSPKQPRARSKFTKCEDILLVNLVNELGTRDWDAIAARIPNRNSRQCRERYTNYLSPNISHEPWSPEEDILLEQKLQELGPKWVNISKFFKNRTDTMLKNRWLVLSRRSPYGNKNHEHNKILSMNVKHHNVPMRQDSMTQLPPKQPMVQINFSMPSIPKVQLPSLGSLLNDKIIAPTLRTSATEANLIAFDVDQFTRSFTRKPQAI